MSIATGRTSTRSLARFARAIWALMRPKSNSLQRRPENAEASDAVFEPRRAVGVRDIRHDCAARQAVASHDFQGHAIGDFTRHAAKIQREQDRAVSGRIGHGERFDPEILRRAFGGMIAGGVTGHPERVGWRDFFPTDAGAPTGASSNPASAT